MRDLSKILDDIRATVDALRVSVDKHEKTASAYDADRQVVFERAEKLTDLLIANRRIKPEQRKETIEKLASHTEALAMFWAAEKQRSSKVPAHDIGFAIGGDSKSASASSDRTDVKASEAFRNVLFS